VAGFPGSFIIIAPVLGITWQLVNEILYTISALKSISLTIDLVTRFIGVYGNISKLAP